MARTPRCRAAWLPGFAGLLSGACAALLAGAGAARAQLAVEVIGAPDGRTIVTVRPGAISPTRQGLGQFVGISGANSGARGLSLNRVVIPPGGRAAPHRHLGSESAIYLLQGTVETRYGERLEQRVINRAGDFLFIPAGVPHQPINLSASEPAIAIVARNDPEEQEHVELLDPAAVPRP
jgi:uncharacterized RmlC-like cupin family protein